MYLQVTSLKIHALQIKMNNIGLLKNNIKKLFGHVSLLRPQIMEVQCQIPAMFEGIGIQMFPKTLIPRI